MRVLIIRCLGVLWCETACYVWAYGDIIYKRKMAKSLAITEKWCNFASIFCADRSKNYM